MTSLQLAHMMAHQDPRVREYALRHAALLASEGEVLIPRDHAAGDEMKTCIGTDDGLWDIIRRVDGRHFAVEVMSDTWWHALQMPEDLWYIYNADASLVLRDPTQDWIDSSPGI